MRLVLSKLYVILDAALLSSTKKQSAKDLGIELADAGVRLLQYRDKLAHSNELLRVSRELAPEMRARGAKFIVNDRADVAALAEADGVHVGQDDLTVDAAREIVGAEKLVGVSTHNVEQFREAVATSADYIAVGPIFETGSKANPDPVVGTQLLREVRGLTGKLIIAIGGITLGRAPDVIAAGADSLAVISDIMRARSPAERARQYLDALGESSSEISRSAHTAETRSERNG
jgi:thiamine-phosphate pyrophosphorylase